MKTITSLLFVCILALGANLNVTAQEALKPKPSPMALTKVMLGDAYVSVVYSRPHKKDREIFGKLVPFGKVWRFGANEATQFTTTNDLMIGGKELKAGTYSLFATPEKDKWTLIFSSALGKWGSYQYESDKEVLKVEVATAMSDEEWEPFTIMFDKADGKKTNMKAMWDKTMISVPVEAK